MMDSFCPSFTKKVPTIEVTMQAAPMASGYIIIVSRLAWPAKKIAASTMVATTVTA